MKQKYHSFQLSALDIPSVFPPLRIFLSISHFMAILLSAQSLVTEDTTAGEEEVTIRADLYVEGNTDASTAALEVDGDTVVLGDLILGPVEDGVAAAVAGTIRFNSETSDFEAYDGTEWYSLTFNLEPDTLNSLENLDTRVGDLEDNQITGVREYANYADLPDTGDNNSSYRVSNDPDFTKNGYYHWNGVSYIKDTNLFNGEVSESNTSEAVVGKKIFDFYNSQTKQNLKNTLGDITSNFDSVFNGVDSTATLPEIYTLENEGDSIEFTLSVDDFSDNKGMGFLGEIGYYNSLIGFYTNKRLYVRDVNGSWLTTKGLTSTIQENQELTLKLEWVSGAISIYKDGVFQRNITTGTVKISNIGNSYTNFFKGKIRDIKITIGGVLSSFESPYFLDDVENLSIIAGRHGYLTPEQVASFSNVTRNEELIKNINSVFENSDSYFSRYNGSTSETVLDKEYILSQEGDFVEIEMRLYDGISTYNDGLGCFGVKGDYNNTFGFYDKDSIWFRADGDSTYTKVNDLNGFEYFSKYKILVVNNGTRYELFKDEVSIGVFSKENNFKISNVGFGYTSGAKIDVKSFKINTRSDSFETTNLYFSEASSLDLELRENEPITSGEKVKINQSEFSKCYVSFDPTGSRGNEKFIAFVQNEANSKYYFGFEVHHNVNNDDSLYTNLYRLQQAKIYEYNGVEMIKNGQLVLTSGENEFAYRTPGKVDFTGGLHGDEQLVDINFYIDGVRLTDLITPFTLKSCVEFSYIQKSTMHQTASKVDGVNPEHPTEAIHYKNTIFSNSGYKTKNRLIWQDDLTLMTVYGSLVCLSTEVGGKGQTSRYQIETFDKLGGNKLSEINDNVHVWNETSKMSATVKSEFDVYNNSSWQFIWDTIGYNKYYRNIASHGDKNVKNGEEWNLTTTVKFNKK